VFGKKSASQPEEAADKKEPAAKPPPASDSKKVNIAAKKALLKAYYASMGRTPEQIEAALAELETPEEAQAAPAGSVEDLESQVREIGKLAGDTILQMENQITEVLKTLSGIDERFTDHQQQISTIFENQQTIHSGMQEVRQTVANMPSGGGGGSEGEGDASELLEEVNHLRQIAAQSRMDLEKKINALETFREKTAPTLQELQKTVGENQDEGGSKLLEAVHQLGDRVTRDRAELEERMKKIEGKISKAASQESPADPGYDQLISSLEQCIADEIEHSGNP
jgi:chromosome segregation ATPase